MTRSTPSSAGASLLVAVLLAAAPAWAGDVEEAKLHFERAQTAYKLGQYAEAIQDYEAAYRAMPDPAFLFNIAQAHRQQYRLDKKGFHLHKALSLYKSYLREMPEANNRNTVQKLIEELQSLVTTLEDRADEADKREARLVLRGETAEGGQVSLDGKSIGTVPLSHVVEPGVHLVKVTKAGYKPWSSSVTVAAGSKLDLPVALERMGGQGPAPAPSTPFYKKWWFWTIVGVAVAGGAGTGIYFATRGDDIPAMPEIDLR
jgi:tetratricopeptide (TPR) repeat protein